MDGRKRCNQVHDSLFIDDRGDVFACCHYKPGVIGNIYKDTLEEIYNSDIIRQFRQKEIDGTLACVENCTLPQSGILSDTIEHDYHTDVRQLKILFGERCNVKCIMCTQDHMSKLELDEEVLVSNVEIPRSRPTVIFQGGETLILKSAKRFFDHCADNGSKIGIITNGTAISEEMAKKIALHCSNIEFSLNAASKETHEIVNVGSRFEKVLRNIKRVIEAKRRFNGTVTIIGHMTIVPENIHEIPEFIRKKAEFGFERISFGYDKSVPGMLTQNPTMKAELSIAVRAELARTNPTKHVYASRLRMLGLA
jgi:MoaA/NifB/PqqE/SkfB family radical SAM enzyme